MVFVQCVRYDTCVMCGVCLWGWRTHTHTHTHTCRRWWARGSALLEEDVTELSPQELTAAGHVPVTPQPHPDTHIEGSPCKAWYSSADLPPPSPHTRRRLGRVGCAQEASSKKEPSVGNLEGSPQLSREAPGRCRGAGLPAALHGLQDQGQGLRPGRTA